MPTKIDSNRTITRLPAPNFSTKLPILWSSLFSSVPGRRTIPPPWFTCLPCSRGSTTRSAVPPRTSTEASPRREAPAALNQSSRPLRLLLRPQLAGSCGFFKKQPARYDNLVFVRTGAKRRLSESEMTQHSATFCRLH